MLDLKHFHRKKMEVDRNFAFYCSSALFVILLLAFADIVRKANKGILFLIIGASALSIIVMRASWGTYHYDFYL